MIPLSIASGAEKLIYKAGGLRSQENVLHEKRRNIYKRRQSTSQDSKGRSLRSEQALKPKHHNARQIAMATKNKIAFYEFRRKLEALKNLKGRGTELISLYIPPDKQIHDVTNKLREEVSQSSNIKSKGTKKNVGAALESIMGRIKNFRKPPENGLVFFVGHVKKSGDQTYMYQELLEPPEPVDIYIYRCDSDFYLEPLSSMLKPKEVYGLLVVDRSEATIGVLRGSKTVVLKNIQSRVPSKHGKGGQSQQRFERLIEIAAHEFFKKVGDITSDYLLQENVQGLLVGGPGATKDYFVEKDFLDYRLKEKVVDTFDTGYTSEFGLTELMQNAQDALKDIDLMKERVLMQRFMREVTKSHKSLASYGEEEVRQHIVMGAVEVLLLSDSLRKSRQTIKCPACGFELTRTVETGPEGEETPEDKVCEQCEGSHLEIETMDVIEELSMEAEKMSSEVALISDEFAEGQTLVTAFGGIAAILRYALDG